MGDMTKAAGDAHRSPADLVLLAVVQALSGRAAALERRHRLLPLMVRSNLITWRHQLTCGRLHSCTFKRLHGDSAVCVLPHLTDVMLAAGYSAGMSCTAGCTPAQNEDGAAAAAFAAVNTPVSATTSGDVCAHLTSLPACTCQKHSYFAAASAL